MDSKAASGGPGKPGFIDTFKSICGSVFRTTVNAVRNLPSRINEYVRRRISEYRRRPARDFVNKVYVLVGYTTKEHIDSKHNTERSLIILRRGLLAIIFLLIILISINSVLPRINFDQYRDMFGISTVDGVTRNDPFSGR